MSQQQGTQTKQTSRAAMQSAAPEIRESSSAHSSRAQSVEISAAMQDSEEVDVQLDGASPASLQAKEIRSLAVQGLSGAGQALPHLDQIQKSFGGHDMTGVKAHVGGEAEKAASAMGAKAYTSGDRVAFKGTPDLWSAAHEAAHVVQQRGGVQLEGGVGKTGDAYEKHANAVADRVVAGKSTEGLLGNMSGGPKLEGLQLLGDKLDEEAKVKPAHGEDKGTQRRFTPEQYIEMWEEEQGRKLSAKEKETINRGCIGLTATNIAGGGNPLNYAVACYADFDKAHEDMTQRNKPVSWLARLPLIGKFFANKEKYILFAKLFWSNQDPDPQARKKSDPTAFVPNAEGKVDMKGYNYERQPGYVNFDYGWWDDESKCFWHANHMDYGDPADPMIVMQSTKEKFAKKISYLGGTRYGYVDFDRVIYCVAPAKNYDPGLAAIASAKP